MDKGDRVAIDVLLPFGPEQIDAFRREAFDRRIEIFSRQRKMMNAAARFRSKNFAIGDAGSVGSINSSLALPRSKQTNRTP